jgi:hypothetical protein
LRSGRGESVLGDMVVVKVHGGLGNQLFQYAFGAALAKQLGTDLAVDTFWYRFCRSRAYYLDHFAAHPRPVSTPELRRLRMRWLRLADLFLGKVGWRGPVFARECRNPCYLNENMPHFEERMRAPGGDVYVDGYWQRERYFKDSAPDVRKAFALRDGFVAKKDVAEKIRAASAPVSLHVRRGDFVAHSIQLPLAYYEAALAYLTARVTDPHFFVFSDDLAWCAKTFSSLPYRFTFVGGTTPGVVPPTDPLDAPWEDLALMALCRHHIIANSTFSWWGAWLSAFPGKMVIAPARKHSPEYTTPEMYPPEWMVL